MNNESTCPNCGAELVHTPGRRKKKFCSNNCRSLYWQKTHAKAFVGNGVTAAQVEEEVILPVQPEAKYVTIDEVVKTYLDSKKDSPDDVILVGPFKIPPDSPITETITHAEEFPPQPAQGGYFDLPVSPPQQQGNGFDYYIEKIPELMYEQEFKNLAAEIDNDPGLSQKQKDLLKIKMRTANL